MSGQFLIVPYKPRKLGKEQEGLKATCLNKLKAMFEADHGEHTFKVVVLRAPAQSHLDTGVHLPKITEAAIGAKEKIEGAEVFDFTIQPEYGIIAAEMNIPVTPGK